ncbi:hypothetical protein FHS85_002436 [Rhodoligotrophos appendicifer]
MPSQILTHRAPGRFWRQAFLARYGALPMDISADVDSIDRKALAADQTLGYAALNGHLELLPQQVAFAEAAVLVLRNNR